jgi:hypothetical protein
MLSHPQSVLGDVPMRSAGYTCAPMGTLAVVRTTRSRRDGPATAAVN